MKNLNPFEKDIEKRVCAFAEAHGILVYKFTSPSRRSVPDRMFILPGGRVFWIEFKRAGCVPTASQEVEIAKMRKQGATVYVVDNVEQGKAVVDRFCLGNALLNVMIKDPAFT